MATLLYTRTEPLIDKLFEYNLLDQDKLDHLFCSNFVFNSMFKNSIGVDRSIDSPLNYVNVPIPTLRSVDSNIGTHLDERAQYFWSLNKPLKVLWSGGIDSTSILVALMRTNSKWYESLQVITAHNEYSLFAEKYLEPKNCLINMEDNKEVLRDMDFYDKNSIYINGECADQLFGYNYGAMIYKNQFRFWKYADIQKFIIDYTWPKIINTQYINNKTTNDMILSWLDDFVARAPFEIKTGNDFAWWCNFALRWHDKMAFKYVGKVGTPKINTVMNCFFATDNFQLWSMINHDAKFEDINQWKTYKQPLKNYIHEFTGDDDYRVNMIKVNSPYSQHEHKIEYCDDQDHIYTNYNDIPKEILKLVIK